jgi:pimeloyl-ACP methyl ester carboxylesterase
VSEAITPPAADSSEVIIPVDRVVLRGNLATGPDDQSPDLAAAALTHVHAPTLLIVGSLDVPVIAMNEQALAAPRTEKALEIVPGASHLFEEPGTLDIVARPACEWFRRHLRSARSVASR